MITINCDRTIMVRRCFITLRLFRIFVVGIGFFTLCFLLMSLGWQFFSKHLEDSPFAMRKEVMGGPESRGMLRKMSYMLEIIMKRMDMLVPMEKNADLRNAEDLVHYSLDSFQQSAGLMEKIQVIAQNVSEIAMKVDQILRNSHLNEKAVSGGRRDLCEVPKDPRFLHCSSKMEWMRSNWTSDPCYAFYGVDGTECSFLIYLSEVEWFCPKLPWRNLTQVPPIRNLQPRKQAAFRLDLAPLLDLLGSGKESLIFMKKRIMRLASHWLLAARRLEERLKDTRKEQMQILVHMGFLTEESGDIFSPQVLKGGPLGEMVQWADILATLFMLGHSLKVTVSVKDLQSSLGVPPRRGNCPLTGPLPYDLIYTDYHGMRQMKQRMGISFNRYRCHMRVVDIFGTEPAYNHEEYAMLHKFQTDWGHWNLRPQQFVTMFPHTPDNSFMGFVSEELNDTEKHFVKMNKVDNMAVVYGKEASIWEGKENFLAILNKYMEIHGTVYYESQQPPEVPPFVKNHGLLPQSELQQLLKKAKLFIGFGLPYEGPAPLEAIANGCMFLQPRFSPPHSSLNHAYFRGKPTSREVSSQHPYMENYVGKPHVWTVDYNNLQEFEDTLQNIMRTKVEPYLPFEYTCEGMLERIHVYIQKQDFCAISPPLMTANSMSADTVLLPLLKNATVLVWPSNTSSPQSWPPPTSMQVWLSTPGASCIQTCQEHGRTCEPAFFRLINRKNVFQQMNVQCASTESEMNHLYPAFVENMHECFLQKEELLFSCAGYSEKYRRLCPCRDFRRGQVALCQDCL